MKEGRKVLMVIVAVAILATSLACGPSVIIHPEDPHSAGTPISVPMGGQISETEAIQIVSACERALQLELSDGTVLTICRVEEILDATNLVVVGVGAVALASPVPGDEAIVGAIWSAGKVVKLVLVGSLIVLPTVALAIDTLSPVAEALVLAMTDVKAKARTETIEAEAEQEQDCPAGAYDRAWALAQMAKAIYAGYGIPASMAISGSVGRGDCLANGNDYDYDIVVIVTDGDYVDALRLRLVVQTELQLSSERVVDLQVYPIGFDFESCD